MRRHKLQWEWESAGRDMLLRFARMVTTGITRMRARRTAITGLAGLMVGCLSEQDRGSAAALDSGRDSDGVGLDSAGDLALADDLDSAAGRDLVAGRESAYVGRLAMDSAAVSHAEVTSAAAVPAAEAARMVEAVRMGAVTAADTGKIQL
jgi:hypothetical protein